MAVTLTLIRKNISLETGTIERRFKAVLTGNYDAVNGQTIDFTAATASPKTARIRPPAKPLPPNDDVQAVQAPLGFTAEVKQNAASPTLANFVLRVFNIATAAELATAAYPAGALNNAVYFSVFSKKRHG